MRRLRDAEVATYNETDYSTMLGDLVNEVKSEVENAWDWGNLRTTVTVTTSVGVANYSLASVNDGFKVLQAINDTDDSYLQKIGFTHMNALYRLATIQSAAPVYFAMNSKDASDNYTLDVYPSPDGVYDLRFYIINPQDDLSADADVITVPSLPVVLGTYARALEERGEDMGTTVTSAFARYQSALSDAIAKDTALYDNEIIWEAV